MPPPPPPAHRPLAAAAALALAAVLHVAAALLVMLAHLQAALRPRPRPKERRGSVVTEDASIATLIRPLARLHGADTVAHASVMGREFSHYVLPGAGALAFAVARGAGRAVPMALGDPLAPEAAWGELVDGFLADVAERECRVPRADACFWHASPRFATFLATRYGMCADAFGAETRLDVGAWKFGGRTRTIRRDARQARDGGRVVVFEATAADLDAPGARTALAAMSAAWRAGKAVSDRALRAFCRTPDWGSLRVGDAEGGRLFVAVVRDDKDDAPPRPAITAASLAGAVLLDPAWRDGAVIGYFPTLNQMAPSAHQGTLKAVYETVLATLKTEGGARELNLGFAPAFATRSASAALPAAPPSAWAPPLIAAAYDHGNALYAFAALAASKTRWAGTSFDAAKGAFGEGGAATATHIYVVHGRAAPSPLAVLDLLLCLRWLGFVDSVAGLVAAVTGVALPGAGAASADDQPTERPPTAPVALARPSPPLRPTTPMEGAAAMLAQAAVAKAATAAVRAAAVDDPSTIGSPHAAAVAAKTSAKTSAARVAKAEDLSPVSCLLSVPSPGSSPQTKGRSLIECAAATT